MYFGNPVIVSVNLSFVRVTVFPSTSSPSASNCIVIDVGLIPSWSSSSSHTFVIVASVVSGSCTLVILNELFPIEIALPVSYPSIKSNSPME